MRRALSLTLALLVFGLISLDAQAGIGALRCLSFTDAALRMQVGQQRAHEAIGAQRVAAAFNHL